MALTPLELTAGASLLQNQGLVVSLNLVANITAYQNSTLISPLRNTIINGYGNVSANITANLLNLGSSTCPALSDSIPSAYTTLSYVSNTNPGLASVVYNTANVQLGSGDLTKFAQAFSVAGAYAAETNVFLNSAINANTYLANTFTNMDNLITGDLTTVNLASQAFGSDLARLGKLINFRDLGNLGSPAALLKQLAQIGNFSPALTQALVTAGVPSGVIANISSGSIVITDSVQRAMYAAMQNITGTELEQVLQIFDTTTQGIETMADLLNPVKLFPNSFQSLTVSTSQGDRGIYLNSVGAVNEQLKNLLPKYLISSA